MNALVSKLVIIVLICTTHGQVQCSAIVTLSSRSTFRTILKHPITQLSIGIAVCWLGYRITQGSQTNTYRAQPPIKTPSLTTALSAAPARIPILAKLSPGTYRHEDCIKTAQAILRQLVGKHVENVYQPNVGKCFALCPPLITDKSFTGEYDKFSPDLPVAQKLFNDGAKHLVFYINLCCNCHAFVIQKFFSHDTNKTYWIAYESSLDRYKLAHWLGELEWPPTLTEKEPTRTALFHAYGGRKLLTNPNDVRDLIEAQVISMTKHYSLDGKPCVTREKMSFYIKMFPGRKS